MSLALTLASLGLLVVVALEPIALAFVITSVPTLIE